MMRRATLVLNVLMSSSGRWWLDLDRTRFRTRTRDGRARAPPSRLWRVRMAAHSGQSVSL